jgi:hypothetical protein
LQEYLTRVDELIRDKHDASLEAKSKENKEKELVAQSNMYVPLKLLAPPLIGMGGGFDGGMGILCYGGMPPMGTYYQNTHTMHYTCNVRTSTTHRNGLQKWKWQLFLLLVGAKYMENLMFVGRLL